MERFDNVPIYNTNSISYVYNFSNKVELKGFGTYLYAVTLKLLSKIVLRNNIPTVTGQLQTTCGNAHCVTQRKTNYFNYKNANDT